MNLLTSILSAVHEPAPLALPIWAFPLIAAVAFTALGLVTFSYRDIAHRHADKVARSGRSNDEHGAGH